MEEEKEKAYAKDVANAVTTLSNAIIEWHGTKNLYDLRIAVDEFAEFADQEIERRSGVVWQRLINIGVIPEHCQDKIVVRGGILDLTANKKTDN
jgi:hypothetical protein